MMADCPSAGRISAQLGSAVNNTTVSRGPETKHYLPFFSNQHNVYSCWSVHFLLTAFVRVMDERSIQLTPYPCSNYTAPLIWKHFIPIRHSRTFQIAEAVTHLSLVVSRTLRENKTEYCLMWKLSKMGPDQLTFTKLFSIETKKYLSLLFFILYIIIQQIFLF